MAKTRDAREEIRYLRQQLSQLRAELTTVRARCLMLESQKATLARSNVKLNQRCQALMRREVKNGQASAEV